MPILYHYGVDSFLLPYPQKTRQWIQTVVAGEGRTIGTLSYFFCSDDRLFKLNQEFLHHSSYTDILTFDYGTEKMVEGEMLISLNRVAENADLFHTSFENELYRVMIHGILHLCGYLDNTKSEKEKMTLREDHWLSLHPKLSRIS